MMYSHRAFYVYIVQRPILRHLDEFGKGLVPRGKYTFFAGGGLVLVSTKRAMTNFHIFLLYLI